MLPVVHWSDIKWPILILPHCKFKEVPGFLTTYVTHLLLRDSYPANQRNGDSSEVRTKPTVKLKSPRSPTQKLMLATLAMFASIQAAPTIQLKSERLLRKRLQRFKTSYGGLNTVKLSSKPCHQSIHKAFLQQINFDTLNFAETVGAELPVVNSIVDTGASFTSVHNMTLVIPNSLHKLSVPLQLDGIAGGYLVEYICVIEFECMDKAGNTFSRRTPAYYHPELPCTLISPQSFLQDQHLQKVTGDLTALSSEEDRFSIYRDRVEWHCDGEHKLDISYDFAYVPRLPLFPKSKAEATLKAYHYSVLHKSNKNLTPLQKVWLKLHNILGHPSFSLIQQLAVGGWFDTKALGLSQLPLSAAPMCAACKFGKQTRRPDNTTTVSKKPEKEGVLKEGFTVPGMRIFSDQLTSIHPGRLFHTAGRELSQNQFCGATIFVDAASGYLFAVPQVTLNASDTINAKHEFERHALEMGVVVDAYHTDNGVYKSKAFTEELAQNYQNITFSGVGAKWQNGVSEGAIRIIVSKARTMMIHAHLHWPDVKDDSLWPMAVAHAVHVYNHTPNERSGIAPIQIFSSALNDGQALRNLHTWGCPAYVLEPKLTEAGGKIPKWKPRSRRGQYVGVSPVHAETVALIRNLNTGYLSPQYHVVFDDEFETVYADEDEPPPEWENMCIFQRFQVEFEDGVTPPSLSSEWLSPDELHQQSVKRHLSELRGGRKLYQDVHNKDVKEDLIYQPPPPDPVFPPTPRKPPDPVASPTTRELHNWTRSSPTPSTQSPPPVHPVEEAPKAQSQPQPSPRRNPSRSAARSPMNVESFTGKSYD